MMDEDTKQPISITTTTQCDHFYISGDEVNGLREVFCNKCSHGMQIDPKLTIKEGQIQWKP